MSARQPGETFEFVDAAAERILQSIGDFDEGAQVAPSGPHVRLLVGKIDTLWSEVRKRAVDVSDSAWRAREFKAKRGSVIATHLRRLISSLRDISPAAAARIQSAVTDAVEDLAQNPDPPGQSGGEEEGDELDVAPPLSPLRLSPLPPAPAPPVSPPGGNVAGPSGTSGATDPSPSGSKRKRKEKGKAPSRTSKRVRIKDKSASADPAGTVRTLNSLGMARKKARRRTVEGAAYDSDRVSDLAGSDLSWSSDDLVPL
ncbi:unnamed protein product [Parajaminaea phylloscopi]